MMRHERLDATHDPARRSWVESAANHPEFPIQNLPLGVFSPSGGAPRIGAAIGDAVFDLASGLPDAPDWCGAADLRPWLAMTTAARTEFRARIADALDHRAPARLASLHPAASCTMHLPAMIGDYTDFFAGIHHATNTGRFLRPERPLIPNYKYVPVAYHGRASSIRVSGVPVRRPLGQRKPGSQEVPDVGPSRALDFELELGFWIGPGNALGTRIPIAEAGAHIAGFCLLNDWSARDIQGWEYQPLGPFLAKSFHTTLSPWIVTADALAPFRIAQAARPDGDPPPLPYLLDADDQAYGALDLTLEVLIETATMRVSGQRAHLIARSNARHLYWTPAQMVAHHTIGGCDLRAGDVFGSGTVSAPEPGGYGSLLEMTGGGRQKITLPNGEQRRFLEDGDEIILRAVASRPGFASIGFGECRGRIVPAT